MCHLYSPPPPLVYSALLTAKQAETLQISEGLKEKKQTNKRVGKLFLNAGNFL